MAITVADLIEKLQELPPDWEVFATRSGKSLEVHEPAQSWWESGHRYGYIFTDNVRPIRFQTKR